MQYRTLGRTGLTVSETGFGAWAIGGPARLGDMEIGWGQTNDSRSLSALKAAFNAGVNFFDTADVYGDGHSEELIGKAFRSQRDKIIIASKGGNRTVNGKWIKDFSPKWVSKAVEASLSRLCTDYLDVYLLHTPRSPEHLQQAIESFDCLEKLKDAGKVRYYGISIAPLDDGLAMIRAGRGDVIEVVYNILNREAETELLPLAAEHNIGIIARVPLASGFLTGKFTKDTRFPPNDHRSHSLTPGWIEKTVAKIERLRFLTEGKKKTLAQAALQFVLSHPAVSVVIPGAKNTTQVLENVGASDGVLLSKEELKRIREVIPSEEVGRLA
jgi:aryl-alcohol dehydrogenase-like predicted oxidoreductase